MNESFPNTQVQSVDSIIAENRKVLLSLKNGNMMVGSFEDTIYGYVEIEDGLKVKVPVKYKFKIRDVSHPDYNRSIELDSDLINFDEMEVLD